MYAKCQRSRDAQHKRYAPCWSLCAVVPCQAAAVRRSWAVSGTRLGDRPRSTASIVAELTQEQLSYRSFIINQLDNLIQSRSGHCNQVADRPQGLVGWAGYVGSQDSDSTTFLSTTLLYQPRYLDELAAKLEATPHEQRVRSQSSLSRPQY
jgi:hypothetical protein